MGEELNCVSLDLSTGGLLLKFDYNFAVINILSGFSFVWFVFDIEE